MKSLFQKLVRNTEQKEFFNAFKEAVTTRGVVAYFQDAREVNINRAGLVEALAVEGTTTKMVLLPGDPYDFITPKNLVAFEPLNRRTRRAMEKIRSKTPKK